MAETKDIIDALSDGDNLGAEEAFKGSITGKVADALEVKRKEVANNFVKTKVTKEKEDVEKVWCFLHSSIRKGWA